MIDFAKREGFLLESKFNSGRLLYQMSTETWTKALSQSFENCQWKSVLFYCDRLLKLNPSNLKTLFCRAFALFCNQQYSELEQWMTSLPNDVAKNEQLLVMRCKGLEATKNFSKIVSILGGYTDTISLVIPVITIEEVNKSKNLLFPIRENALFNLSQTDYLPKQNIKTNEKETPPPNDPMNPPKLVELIKEAMMKNDPDLLQPFTLMTDKTTESDPLILTACGCYSLLNDQIEAGETFLIKATEEDPDCEIAWLCLILSFTNSAEWDQGLSALRKVIRRFPTSVSVSMFALSLHLKSGSASLAAPFIQLLAENQSPDLTFTKYHKVTITPTISYPDLLFVIHERGVASLMEGDVTQATHDFKDVIEKSQERDLIGAASLNLGHCYRKMGDFDKAINCYEDALSYSTRTAEALASIGFSYHLKGERDEAILYYHRCLSIDSVHPFATKMLDIAVRT